MADFVGTGDDAPKHQYPSYKPTIEYQADFVAAEDGEPLLDRPLGDSFIFMPSAISNPAHDLTTMVYITNVPLSMKDYALEQLLWVCGPVRRYHRVRDWYGKPRKSAFCVFENSLGLIRCLRVIGGEGHEGLPIVKGGLRLVNDKPQSQLTVVCDPIARFSIKNTKDQAAAEADRQVFAKMKVLLDQLELDPNEDFGAPLKMPGKPSKRPSRPDAPLPQREEESEDEDQVRKRLERKKEDRELAFKDRERRWEHSEQSRLRRTFADIESDEHIERKKIKDKEFFTKYLAEFDDDVEMQRGELEYFRDRSRWWSKRVSKCRDEEDADKYDRRQEYEENEIKNGRDPNRPKREERVHIPEPEGFMVSKIMTQEERKTAIKELIAKIPAEKEQLWSWEIKWDQLDDTILNKKIQPFVSKKIAEIVGFEEKDLVDFCVRKIRSQGSAQDICDELEPVLDEETQVFVMTLWRMVIFETEARAKGL
ncbi:hypothetical protein EDD86DRAFT_198355 [Gorgonomyces haynaldii]|nr:hypothetical protein EDD86DRAFT_198355 [Gorgonomyces haynaldii]